MLLTACWFPLRRAELEPQGGLPEAQGGGEDGGAARQGTELRRHGITSTPRQQGE